MKKIKILHITHAHGGIKTYIENITNNIDCEKFDSYLLGTEVNKNYKGKFKNKIDINFTREPNFFKDIFDLYKTTKAIKQIAPDIVHCHSGKGGLIGKISSMLLRKKCIFTPNAFSYLGFTGVKRKFYFIVEKITMFIPNKLLAVSKSELKRAVEELKYDNGKVTYIPNSIYVGNYHARSPKIKKVGMIGRLIYQKNPLMFLKAAYNVHIELPDVKFELLGAGYQDYLSFEANDYIKKNNMDGYFTISSWGNYNNSNDFYNTLSVYVLTSNFEGLPFSLLEAMSQGIPCIATDVDGNLDIIKTGFNGFLVPGNDDNTMAKVIMDLLLDEKLYQQISLEGYKSVLKDYNITKNISKYEDLYLKVINKN